MRKQNKRRNGREGKERDNLKTGNTSVRAKKGEKEYETEEGKVVPLNNDPNWYFDDQQLMEQVSNFSLNQFLGTKIPAIYQVHIPTMMRLLFNPCPGWNPADGVNFTGINQAGMKLYTILSSGNSKNTQYAPQDVTTLMLALGEILSVSEVGRRALGLAFTYNKRNWSYAYDAIEVAGFKAGDMLAKLGPYRIAFNTTINAINKISFPATIRYFAKCVYMYSHIFLDSESPMAQSYVYLPRTTWIIDETTYEEGTILKTTNLWNTDTVMNFDDYLATLNDMITAILDSATFQYIYADVLRLFGDGGLYTVPFITEDYMVMPEYDPLALLQINNAMMVPSPEGTTFSKVGTGSTPANDVYPNVDNNSLIYAPQFRDGNAATYPSQSILNFPHSMGNPDVTQRVESTRFVAFVERELGPGAPTVNAALPDHYLCGMAIFNYAGLASVHYLDNIVPLDEHGAMSENDAKFVFNLGKFDWAPILYLNTDQDNIVDTIGDVDFYTTVNFDYIRRMNDLVYVSLFS